MVVLGLRFGGRGLYGIRFFLYWYLVFYWGNYGGFKFKVSGILVTLCVVFVVGT